LAPPVWARARRRARRSSAPRPGRRGARRRARLCPGFPRRVPRAGGSPSARGSPGRRPDRRADGPPRAGAELGLLGFGHACVFEFRHVFRGGRSRRLHRASARGPRSNLMARQAACESAAAGLALFRRGAPAFAPERQSARGGSVRRPRVRGRRQARGGTPVRSSARSHGGLPARARIPQASLRPAAGPRAAPRGARLFGAAPVGAGGKACHTPRGQAGAAFGGGRAFSLVFPRRMPRARGSPSAHGPPGRRPNRQDDGSPPPLGQISISSASARAPAGARRAVGEGRRATPMCSNVGMRLGEAFPEGRAAQARARATFEVDGAAGGMRERRRGACFVSLRRPSVRPPTPTCVRRLRSTSSGAGSAASASGRACRLFGPKPRAVARGGARAGPPWRHPPTASRPRSGRQAKATEINDMTGGGGGV
jgi:hypothetical protein